MTISFTVLGVVTIPGQGLGPDVQRAVFAVTNDTVTFYRGQRGGIAAGADVPTYLTANADALYAEAVAGGVTLTQGQVNVGNYAYQHWQYRNVFAAAHYRYTIGMLSGAATLAAYRTVLGDAFAELAPLSGSQFDTEFANERTALGLTTAIGSMTLAQCQAFATLLDRWLSARRVDVLLSMSFYGMHE